MKNQETSEDGRTDSHKRKWFYSEQNNAYTNYADDPSAKKCLTANGSGGGGANYDYENYQPNHQLSPSNAVGGQSTTMTMVNELCKNAHELASMELSENIEYVNILYDENLLSGVQAAQAADPNYINFEPNWNNADILDLDQRNYYYETTVVPNVIDLNEQHQQHHHHQQQHPQHHQGEQMCQVGQTSVHHQEQYSETAMQSQPNLYIESTEQREIAAPAAAPLRKSDARLHFLLFCRRRLNKCLFWIDTHSTHKFRFGWCRRRRHSRLAWFRFCFQWMQIFIDSTAKEPKESFCSSQKAHVPATINKLLTPAFGGTIPYVRIRV